MNMYFFYFERKCIFNCTRFNIWTSSEYNSVSKYNFNYLVLWLLLWYTNIL